MKKLKYILYIKKRIKKEGLNIAIVARAIGVSRQYLHKRMTENIPASKKMAISINEWSNNEISILEAMGIE